MDLAPDLVIGERFRLVRQLGEGGMGAVWLAHHLALDVPCAIKFVTPTAAWRPELRARFEREARAAARIRSSHVVQMLDHGVWNNCPYIAMELLVGEDLGQRLERVRRLTPGETAHMAEQIARALTTAHAAGIVHRDLKPANLFFARDGEDEIVKVLDFGIAKILGSTMASSDNLRTSTGSLLGSPAYMSPEQASGTKVVDHRSDLWSFGVVVFECLTGTKAFDSSGLGELLMKIMSRDAPQASAVAPDLPLAFDAWWERATALAPEQRFQSAKEQADALADALGVARVGRRTDAGAQPFTAAAVTSVEATHIRTNGAGSSTFEGHTSIPAPQASRGRAFFGGLAAVSAAVLVLGGIGWIALRPKPPQDSAASPAIAPAPLPTTPAAVDVQPVPATAAPSSSEAALAPTAEPTTAQHAGAASTAAAKSSASVPPSKAPPSRAPSPHRATTSKPQQDDPGF